MSEYALGIGACVVLIFFLMTGVEIAFGIALVGIAGLMITSGFDVAFNMACQDFYDTLGSYSLTVIPLFMLMGQIAFHAGIAQRLYGNSTCGNHVQSNVRVHLCHFGNFFQRGYSADDPIQLQQEVIDRDSSKRRHHRDAHTSQHQHDHLRHYYGTVHREAVPRGDNTWHYDRMFIHRRHLCLV
jgi:hypothetical protein